MFRVYLFALLALFATAVHADEAVDRKNRSIAELSAQSIPVLKSLPVIETEATSLRRTDEEVTNRLIALVIVAIKGETNDPDLVAELIETYQATSYFTPVERAFVKSSAPTEQELIDASWRYEGAHVMFWALGLTDQMEPLDTIVSVPEMVETLRSLGPDGLRAQARLRPQAEILDAADYVYRADWAVVEASVQNAPAPAGLEPGIVYERHYALNWLIGYAGLSWDDMSTDT